MSQQQGQQPTGYTGDYQQSPPQQGYQQQSYQQQGYPQDQQQYSPQNIHISVGQSTSNDPDFIQAQQILSSEFCGCLSDPAICLCSTFCYHIQFGLNYEASGQGSCLLGWCCACFLCSSRGHIQRLARVPQDNCCTSCLLHLFCPICSVAQEGRAVKSLKAAHLRQPVM